ncbi:monovalent cation/H(+) antiporter subunit G [Sphingomonas mollis]|uniref:Monovalent cation/H(+) antiporter subunit G n=1 Tax=Sphingomonas mollis TaxID=2795726 RepID=A0ABS0XK57_9SPHN|nr:monovalent cation/H(+) antiporter subunit G [Sphingomonas sp. BT553]MBJ6120414.1 monovalent cation/H(+) antiporter subunit G [Sphingomonas sp. BT553]
MIVLGVAMLALGVGFLLVAAIGLVRLPDPFQRMHSATKAGTLGTSLIVLGVLLLDQTARLSTGLLTILFLLLTLPIGAQLLGRAAYLSGARMEGVDDDPLADVLDRAEAKPTDRPD